MKDSDQAQLSGDVVPDGRLAWQTPDARNYRIRDLASGREELLVKNPEVGCVFQPHFSPRGDQVAVTGTGRRGTKDTARNLGAFVARPRGAVARAESLAHRMVGNGEWIYAYEASTSAVVRVSPRTIQDRAGWKLPQGTLGISDCSLTPDRQSIVCALTKRLRTLDRRPLRSGRPGDRGAEAMPELDPAPRRLFVKIPRLALRTATEGASCPTGSGQRRDSNPFRKIRTQKRDGVPNRL